MACRSVGGWVVGVAAWFLTVVVVTSAQAGSYAYIPNDQSGTVSVIDATSGILVATVDVGDGPSSAVVSPDRTRAYVGNAGSQTISVIDTMTHAVVGTIPLTSQPIGALAVSPDNARLYVPLLNATLAVVDTAAGAVVASVPVGQNPASVVVTPDGARAYVTCSGSDRVDVVDTGTNTVTGSIAILSPYGADLNDEGTRLYVASSGADAVAVVDTATNTVAASIPVGSHPTGLAVVGFYSFWSKVYVANSFADTVSVIDTATDTVVATIGVGDYPVGVGATPDGDRVFVLNYSSDTITVVNGWDGTVRGTLTGFDHPSALGAFAGYTAAATPRFVTSWGSTGAGDGQFSSPQDVAVDASGNVYVADRNNNRVQKFDANGAFLTKWGTQGSGDGQFSGGPSSVAVDASGNVYVADTGNYRVQKFDASGGFLAKWGSAGIGDGQFLSGPKAVAVDSSGNVYVADSGNHRVQKFDANGAFLTKWGSLGSGDGQFDITAAVAVDVTGNVYIADANLGGNRVQKFDSSGAFLTRLGFQGSGPGEFLSLGGIDVDASGSVYVTDTVNTIVQQFTADGVFVTMWGGYGNDEGRFRSPRGVAVDSSGAIYVADSYLNRVQKFEFPADVGVRFAAASAIVNASEPFDFELAVTNAGPSTAKDAFMALNLPAGVSFTSATPGQGTCTEAGGTVNCAFGDIPSGGSVDVSVTAEAPAAAGPVTLAAAAESGTWDDTDGNDTASVEIVVNGPPTDIALGPASVEEGQPPGTVVGTFTTTDPNTADTFTYAFASGDGDTDNASFSIVGNELRTGATFDFEANASYTVRVAVEDQGGLTFQRVFAISVTDINEPPTDIALSESTVAENLSLTSECFPSALSSDTRDSFSDGLAAASVYICNVWLTPGGYFSTADPDAGDTFTYALVAGSGDTDNASFAIVAGTLSPTVVFNYELKSSYSIRVRSTDRGGLWFEKAFTITVTDVNERPTDVALSPASVAENQPSGTAVGTFNTTDPDMGNAFTYTLVSGPEATDNASFTISGSTLQTAVVLDFEGKSSYSVRVRAEDQGGFATEEAFTVAIVDLNEPPANVALNQAGIGEGLPPGTPVGTLATIDPDAGNTFTYTLAAGDGDTDNDSFRIEGSQLQTAVVLDSFVKGTYSVRVRSTDQGGLWVEDVLTVTSSTSYVLWTRSDTGQAALWRVETDDIAGTLPVSGSAYVRSKAGVGGPWEATGFSRVSSTEGYVLWTRGDTGQASLWKVDPGTGTFISSAYLYSKLGVGAPWKATSYDHIGPTEGYVLWTRSDTGQAVLWRIDPSSAAGNPAVIGIASLNHLHSTTGGGRPWEATSYRHVSATEGYVLWTRSDTGQALLWRIDPSSASGAPRVIRIGSLTHLYSTTGVGGPWEATSYTHVSETEGYVLWTRSDTGQGVVWRIDPSSASGSPKVIRIASLASLYSKNGVGGPWKATAFVHPGLAAAAADTAPAR